MRATLSDSWAGEASSVAAHDRLDLCGVLSPAVGSGLMPRGKAQKTLDLIDAAAEILREIQPATVRAVCYRLFNIGLIESMTKTCTNRVSTHLTAARENGLIPWEHIVDETREAERISAWSGME